MKNKIENTSILICHGYRTGSNYISSILAHNGFGWPEEYFNLEFQNSTRKYTATKARKTVKDIILNKSQNNIFSAKLPIQDFLWFAHLSGDLKLPLDSISQQFSDTIAIRVIRRDIFLQAISYWRAQKTGEWYRYQHTGGAPPAPDYNQDEIYAAYIYLCREEYIWQEIFSKSRIKLITLFYEEFSENSAILISLMEELRDIIDPGKVIFNRPFELVSDNVTQRDEISEDYRERFVYSLMESFTLE